MKKNRAQSHATRRSETRRVSNVRLIRTIVLGFIAVSVALIWLGDQFGIDRAESLEYLTMALLFVGGLVLLGLVGFLLLLGVKKLF